MTVSHLEWVITVGVIIAVLAFDVVIIARRPHEPTRRECAISLSVYVGLSVAFGLWVWSSSGARYGVEFFTGWLTEYSLSVDNLFVFLLIMAGLRVPARYQQQALLVGIVLALVFRGVFITLGTVAIDRLSWVFYIFGAFLVCAAVRLPVRNNHHGDESMSPASRLRDSMSPAPRLRDADTAVMRFVRRHLNTTDTWDGLKLYRRDGAKRLVTPMLIVIVALGSTDLIFALDSIPAIYGLTKEPYLVFAANVFALMGLRQLYFLLGGLLRRLVYLSAGLAFILGFIGVKLLLHALRENDVPFVNYGRPVQVPEISTLVSLAVIVATLAVTTVASLYKSGVSAAP